MIFERVESVLFKAARNYGLVGARLGPAQPNLEEGFLLGHTMVGGSDASLGDPIYLASDDLRRHLYYVACSGAGKSSLVVRLVDYLAAQKMSVVMLDTLGDLVDREVIRLSATGIDLSDRLTIIDLRQTEFVTGLDPLSGEGDPYGRALQLLSILRQQALSWGVQLEQTLRFCLVTLSLTGRSMINVERLLTDEVFRRQIVFQLSDEPSRAFFERFGSLKQDKQQEFSLPVLNKLSGLLAIPRLRSVFSSPKPINWYELLSKPGQIVLVSLAKTDLHDSADLVGGLIISQLLDVTLSRAAIPEEERVPTALVVDEFANLASDAFERFIAEGRRLRMYSCLLHQSLSQLTPRLADVVRTNVATQLAGSTSSVDGRVLANEMLTDEPPQMRCRRLLELQVGQAYLLRRGQRSVRVQLAYDADPIVDPAIAETVRRQGLSRFAIPSRSPEEWSATDLGTNSMWEVQHETRPRLD